MREEPERGRTAVPLDQRQPRAARRKLRSSRLDVIVGMAFSNLMMFAIIVSTAATLHAHGQHNLNLPASSALLPASSLATCDLVSQTHQQIPTSRLTGEQG